MSEAVFRLLALAAGACATSGILWAIASRAAWRRGLDLGRVPYPLLLLGASTAVALSPSDAAAAIAACATCVGAVCDARTGYIFDPVVGGGLGAVAAVAIWTGQSGTMAGAGAVAGTLLGLWAVTNGRGVGLGDVKLGAVIGAGVGPTLGIAALGAAFVLGAAFSLGRIAAGRARLDGAIRFGPYLAAGTLMVLAYHRLNTGVIR